MPFYEFKCSNCGQRSEALMKVDEACEDGKTWECGSTEVLEKFFNPYGDRLPDGCGGKKTGGRKTGGKRIKNRSIKKRKYMKNRLF